MSHCLILKALLVVVLGSSFLLIGCGKKAQEPKPEKNPVVYRPPQKPNVEEFLSKQGVSCENNQVCPNYMAKIVVIENDKFRFCTGFLTANNVVATSSSCLPGILRMNGQDCSKDAFLFFPETWNRPAERVGCNKVILASQIEGDDPVLWRDDVAFLELEKGMEDRREARIVRDGVLDGRVYTTWMIDQQDDFSAIIKKANCDGLHNNYVNPLVNNQSSPNMLFADCEITLASKGAPVIDGRGRVVAMVSRSMDNELRTYLESTGLLTDGLKQMFHASNFACAPTDLNNDMQDERECLKDLNYARLDKIRSEMLSTNLLFGELRRKLEDSLKKVSLFVNFGVKLVSRMDSQETVIYPKCFKPINGWLGTLNSNRNVFVEDLELPVRSFKRTMDSLGRISTTTLDAPAKYTFVQFSLKNIRSVKKSSILMWNYNEDNSLRTFPEISEECGSLL